METVRNVLYFLFVLLEVILIFNLLIVVHELGHFLAARWRGLVVEQFAVWFGKPLWKRTYNGVVYSLGSIPFGGFVKLPQMAPMDAIEGESTMTRASAMPTVSPLDKIIVAIAGPLFSFGLAFIFAVIVFLIGRPVSEAETSTTIGYVEPDSPAAKAACDDARRAARPAARRRDRGRGRPPGQPLRRHERQRGLVRRAQRGRRRSPSRSAGGPDPDFLIPSRRSQDAPSGWQRKILRQVSIEPAYSGPSSPR